jgi:magnesium chelatase family protein
MPPVASAELLATDRPGATGDELRCRVVAARRRQRERAGCLNARLSAAETERWCRPDRAGTRLIEKAMDRLGLSARGAHRVMRVARSIADLAAEEEIGAMAVSEALGFRRLELADRRG